MCAESSREPQGSDEGGAPDASLVGGSALLAGVTVLAVFAHPDDEALACGGTLARLADAGARVVLVCASRGERGPLSDPALAPDGDVGSVRALELAASAAALGIAEVLLLTHPDGALRWARTLADEIAQLLARYRPGAVVTFDSDGLYWHTDHIGVHEATTGALALLGADAPPLYYVTLQPGAMRAIADATHLRGGAPPEASLWGISPDAFGLLSPPHTFRVDVRDWAPRKLAALRCHRSQTGPSSPFDWMDDADARRWLGLELFRRAPMEGSGADLLEWLREPEFEA